MKKINIDTTTIKSTLDKNKELNLELNNLRITQGELNRRLTQIYDAKSFKLWQKFNKIKKYLNFKNFVKINKIIYKNGFNSAINKISKTKTQENISEQINFLYNKWLVNNLLSEKELIIQKESSKKFKIRPRISIITPTYNTPEKFLRECIESTIKQTYDNWELCIADDNSTNFNVKNIIEEYSKKDKRIKYVFRKNNGHICAASNSALKIASGEYIALLDHDDLLLPNSLYEVVSTINDNPEVDFIYSDEDKMSEDGITPVEPYFKPDWSLDKLFGFMYIGHLSVYKKSIIKSVSGFSVGTHGAQDYDLLLKSIPYINLAIHIPKILYRWRRHPDSTSTTLKAKPYAMEAGKNVLKSRLSNYIKGKFNVINPNIGYYLLSDFSINKKSIDVFINSKKIKQIPKNLNNKLGNKINSYIFFSSIKQLNDLLKNSNATYFLVINQKFDFLDNNILDFIGYLNIKNVGIIGPKIVDKNNKIISSGYCLDRGKLSIPFINHYDSYGYGNNLAVQSNTLGINNYFFALKNETFKSYIKKFDSNLPNLYLLKNSIDLITQNIRTVIYPQFTIISTNMSLLPKNETQFIENYAYNNIKGVDPFFNKNLTISNNNLITLYL